MHPKQTVFYSLVAALSALGLTSILFALGGLYPFGDCTLAWCDMQQQVVPLWMQLSDMLQGEVSPLYSLRAAGGMSLWGVLLFFVASPLSLLSVFWEKGDMLLFANVMTLLKLGCCAATSAWFFHKRYEKLALPTVCALSLGYAFSGYSMMYYQNSVWLDVMALFPLLLLSMEGLRRRGGGLSYGILLTLCIVTNYYLSYAILIFLALMGGTVCRLCLNGQERGRYALRLGFYTVLALLLSAPVWMPSLWEVLASARNEGLIQSLSGGALLTDMPTTICFLLCSAVTFVPALSCWRLEFPKEAPERAERALLPLLLIPLFVDPINRMWHTGSYQAFPVRYGFLTVLLLLSLSAAWLTRREELPSHSDSGALGTMIGALLVALSVSTLLPKLYFKELTSYVRGLWCDLSTFSFVAMWAMGIVGVAVAMAVLRRRNRLSGRACTVTFLLLTLASVYFSGMIYMTSAARSDAWMRPVTDLEGRIDDPSFYRVKTQSKLFDVNYVGGIGYNTFSHYTSLTGEALMLTLRQLGYSGYWMEAGSHGGTLVTDALLQNRYVIGTTDREIPLSSRIGANSKYCISKNDLTLPFGIVTSAEAVDELRVLPDQPRAFLGEWALTTLTGQYTALFHRYAPTDSQKLLLSDDIDGSIATPLDRTAARILYVIPIERPTVLYLDCFDGASTRLTEHVNGAMSVRVNGIECVASYPSQRENGLLELGYFSEGSVVVELMVKHGVSARSFGVFGLDVNALRGALGAVRGAALNATGRTLSGSAVAEQDGEQLVIQLPWSQGWHATVNGQEHEIEQILGAFMAISLEKGQNCVEMTFFPVGMGMALGIGVVGALAFCWAAHSRRRRKASSDLVVKAALGTLSVCCWLIFFLVYLLPPALWLLM